MVNLTKLTSDFTLSSFTLFFLLDRILFFLLFFASAHMVPFFSLSFLKN